MIRVQLFAAASHGLPGRKSACWILKVSFPKFCELLSQFSLILFHYQVWARFYPFYSVIYPPTELVNAVEFTFFVDICAELSGTERAKIMFVAREIPAEHKDLIHDVSYDYHGRRMATCSSDQSVKVRILKYVLPSNRLFMFWQSLTVLKLKLQRPPRAYPGHLTVQFAR